MAQTAVPLSPGPTGTSWPSALANLYFAPREAFQALLVRPRFWIPLAAWVALSLAFTAVWMQKVDARAYMRQQIEDSGRADKIPPDQMESIVEAQSKAFPIFAWVGPLVFLPLGLLVVAAVYLFVFRFLFGGIVTFGQSAAVLAWTFLAVAVVTTPLTLAVLGLKDDWTLDPRTALQANVSLFLDRATTPKSLYTLVESLDLFSFWTMALMAAGYGVANRKPTSWALWGVVGVWVVYVLGKVGLAAIF
jgi:hypothetical protein